MLHLRILKYFIMCEHEVFKKCESSDKCSYHYFANQLYKPKMMKEEEYGFQVETKFFLSEQVGIDENKDQKLPLLPKRFKIVMRLLIRSL